MRPTNTVRSSHPSKVPLHAAPRMKNQMTRSICRVSHRNSTDAIVCGAQAVWDAYFNKMLSTFHEPNPELNRDLALDRTIRALGHRPMRAGEICAAARLPMGTSRHGTGCYSERDRHFVRKLIREEAFEELCSAAFDA